MLLTKKNIFICVIGLFALLSTGYALYQSLYQDGIQNHNPHIITNFAKKNILSGGDFTLTQHDNKPFQFSHLNGKPRLMYFGFTHCPDFCPTSLQVMDAVSEKIDIHRVFISLDPERDTPDILNNYVSLYKQGLIALTGTLAETDKVAKQWNVYYSFNKQNKDDKDYIVDHTTYLYLIDKHGEIVALIMPDATPAEIIDFIRTSKLG